MDTTTAPAYTPTREDVMLYPDFWLAGPGSVTASQVRCAHDYNLTDSCPNCAADVEDAEADHTLDNPDLSRVLRGLEERGTEGRSIPAIYPKVRYLAEKLCQAGFAENRGNRFYITAAGRLALAVIGSVTL